MDSLVIATRDSPLAIAQSEQVADALCARHRGRRVSLRRIRTRADNITDRPLREVGGKELWVRELEEALRDGHADLAVHSMKDVPVEVSADFAVSSVLRREDPRDVVVGHRGSTLGSLPEGARVGTSSLRRAAQLRRRFPALACAEIRGNVHTRLRRAEEGDCDAVVLAAAGLHRLQLHARISEYLPPSLCLPAAGQGALAVEFASGRGDVRDAISPLVHAGDDACVRAERALCLALGADCHSALGALCALGQNGRLALRAVVCAPRGGEALTLRAEGGWEEAEALGEKLGRQLIDNGALPLLNSQETTNTPHAK